MNYRNHVFWEAIRILEISEQPLSYTVAYKYIMVHFLMNFSFNTKKVNLSYSFLNNFHPDKVKTTQAQNTPPTLFRDIIVNHLFRYLALYERLARFNC